MTTIRTEQVNDYDDVATVNRMAFGQDAEALLVAKLREADGYDPALSLVATCEKRLVGHILFSPIVIETDGDSVPALALAPMAVLPDHQRQGFGSELVREGLDTCRRLGYRIVVVLGHAAFYPRFGFSVASLYGVRCPFPAPDEAFMVTALIPGSLDDIQGVVRYPPVFDQV